MNMSPHRGAAAVETIDHTRRMISRCVVLTLLAVVLASAGCGKARGTVAVTGKAVLKDGRGLPGGRVILTGGKTSASGQIKPDGTFLLGTFTTSDGSKPGNYTVVVVGATEPDTRSEFDRMGGVGKPPPSLIAKKYEAAATSDLKVEIKPPKTHLELVLDPSDAVLKNP
jgi:hypothetical protein